MRSGAIARLPSAPLCAGRPRSRESRAPRGPAAVLTFEGACVWATALQRSSAVLPGLLGSARRGWRATGTPADAPPARLSALRAVRPPSRCCSAAILAMPRVGGVASALAGT